MGVHVFAATLFLQLKFGGIFAGVNEFENIYLAHTIYRSTKMCPGASANRKISQFFSVSQQYTKCFSTHPSITIE